MNTMQAFFGEYLGVILTLIALALGLTIFIFRHRWFDRGYRKGTPANAERVKRQNPPDEWSKSHHSATGRRPR